MTSDSLPSFKLIDFLKDKKIGDHRPTEREILVSIIESSEDAIFSHGTDGVITSWNIGAEKLFGYSAVEAIGKSITILDLEHSSEFENILKKLDRGEKIDHLEIVSVRKNGEKIEISLTISPIRKASGDLIGLSAIARDISAQKRLLVDRLFLASIVESSSDAILTKNLEGIILSWNQGAERIYGYTAEEVIGKPVYLLTPQSKKDEIPQILQRLRKGERIETYETQRMRKDGTIIDVSLTVSPVKDEHDNIIAASAVARDITDRKMTEALIRSQLEEKNLLVQEVYHRVKNNLQILSSLLVLRSRNLPSEELKSAFQETIQRIRAMALVHESMYTSDNLAAINFKNYVERLSKPIIEAYAPHPEKIHCEITGEVSNLKLNLALPLGLIFNELITNAIKYAFNDGHGKIDIHLEENNSVLIVTVSDNGIGLPPSLDPLNSNTFGLRIVRLLTEQLAGQIQVKRTEGTIFILSIPI